MSALATSGVPQGTVTAARASPRPRKFSLSNSAHAMLMTSVSVTMPVVYSTVTHTLLATSGDRTRSR
jgi:hypothetical protein